MREVPLMKTFYPIPGRVHAGRIERLVYDEDNEEWPFVVWVNGEHFSLHAEMVEDAEPLVGDWLVVPMDGAGWLMEEAVVVSDRLFQRLFVTPEGLADAQAQAAAALH